MYRELVWLIIAAGAVYLILDEFFGDKKLTRAAQAVVGEVV